MANWFKLEMDAHGQIGIRPVQTDGVMIFPGAASKGELLGQIEGLIADLERLKDEVTRIAEWPPEDIFPERSNA